jgi:hypothetical protein
VRSDSGGTQAGENKTSQNPDHGNDREQLKQGEG